nr:MAG TPA: hypothetical protein [Caudoviricetes sp.]
MNVGFEYFKPEEPFATCPVISIHIDEQYVLDFRIDGSIMNVDENLVITHDMLYRMIAIGTIINTIKEKSGEGYSRLKELFEGSDSLYSSLMKMCKLIKDQKIEDSNSIDAFYKYHDKEQKNIENARTVEISAAKEYIYKYWNTSAIVQVRSNTVNIEFCHTINKTPTSYGKFERVCGIDMWNIMHNFYSYKTIDDITKRKIDYYIKTAVNQFIEQVLSKPDKDINKAIIDDYLKSGIDRIMKSIDIAYRGKIIK